jgi:hypothetical protein
MILLLVIRFVILLFILLGHGRLLSYMLRRTRASDIPPFTLEQTGLGLS